MTKWLLELKISSKVPKLFWPFLVENKNQNNHKFLFFFIFYLVPLFWKLKVKRAHGCTWKVILYNSHNMTADNDLRYTVYRILKVIRVTSQFATKLVAPIAQKTARQIWKLLNQKGKGLFAYTRVVEKPKCRLLLFILRWRWSCVWSGQKIILTTRCFILISDLSGFSKTIFFQIKKIQIIVRYVLWLTEQHIKTL